ncbi:hypothetical protein CIPAW_03G165000 [Carya illinoinensis]|uniref:Uncharacterized protein n=1 Tax=Carya illinoinensis TaxID=32201 RepID=A0A8T1R3J4_CARIL|nr:hypothetical protein CIPAW_03G165000 [Carya illinoinensis]
MKISAKLQAKIQQNIIECSGFTCFYSMQFLGDMIYGYFIIKQETNPFPRAEQLPSNHFHELFGALSVESSNKDSLGWKYYFGRKANCLSPIWKLLENDRAISRAR